MSAPVGPAGVEFSLDLVLDLVGEFPPAFGEEFDTVVGHGVVAGRQDDAEVGIGVGDQVGDGGCWEDTDELNVGAGAGEPRGDGGLQHFTGGTRVASDDDSGSPGTFGTQDRDGCSSYAHGQVGCEVGVGQSSHSIGPEEASHEYLLEVGYKNRARV